jgi:hypothetical protein
VRPSQYADSAAPTKEAVRAMPVRPSQYADSAAPTKRGRADYARAAVSVGLPAWTS